MQEPTRSPERDALLAAVREIAPVLRECAPEGELLRHLPKASVDALREANLFRCAAPREVGGLGVDPLTQLEVFEAVAAIDGAAGWNLMISAILASFVGSRLRDGAIEDVFSGPTFPCVAGLVWPRGRAERVEGGHRVEGRWSFGSGIHQADWVMGGCLLSGADGPDAHVMAVVPRHGVTIHDNWRVAGLRGTGSCDYSVESTLVPDGFVFGALVGDAHRGEPWQRLPGPLQSAAGHAGFALGIARGVLEALESRVASASRSMTAARTGDRESFQLDLGRSLVHFDAARTLVHDAHRAVWASALAGCPPRPEEVARMRLSATHATDVAVEIAQLGYRAAGTSALFEDSPLQRSLRDILAAQQHMFVRDTGYVELAQSRIAARGTAG